MSFIQELCVKYPQIASSELIFPDNSATILEEKDIYGMLCPDSAICKENNSIYIYNGMYISSEVVRAFITNDFYRNELQYYE